jgi:hypothetical protein
MFFDCYQIPAGILEYLSNRDVMQLSMVNKKIDRELADDRRKRRAKMLDFLLTNHYRADYGVFSIHYYYSTHIFTPHPISHRACFRMIVHFLPELFAFLEQHGARVLDFSEFSRISSDFFFSIEEQRAIMLMILPLIKHNRTLVYVTLNMFRAGLTWELVEETARDHPCLWIDKASPTSFYHHSVIRK